MANIQPRLPGVPAKARPRRSDTAIMRRAAELLAPEVTQWVTKATQWVPGKGKDLDGIVEDLVAGMRPFPDGYKFAKHLEDRGCDPNFRLVEILDGSYRWASQALDEALRGWVEAEHISLDFKVGQIVTARDGAGPIVHLRPETAQYVVAITPEHKASPGSGRVLNAEDVTLVDPEEVRSDETEHA